MTKIVLLTWQFEQGVQTYQNGDPVLDDWITLPARCPHCRAEWQVVTAIHGEGAECPFCGYLDPFYRWPIPDGARDDRNLTQ